MKKTLIGLGVIAVVVALMIWFIRWGNEENTKQLYIIEQRGYDAARDGMPVEGCPYSPYTGYTDSRTWWLSGYQRYLRENPKAK